MTGPYTTIPLTRPLTIVDEVVRGEEVDYQLRMGKRLESSRGEGSSWGSGGTPSVMGVLVVWTVVPGKETS